MCQVTQFQDKKIHFEYLLNVMKTNQIQIKDLIQYVNITEDKIENPFSIKSEESKEEIKEVKEKVQTEEVKKENKKPMFKLIPSFNDDMGGEWGLDCLDEEEYNNITYLDKVKENIKIEEPKKEEIKKEEPKKKNSKPTKQKKLTKEIINNRKNVTSVEEYVECLKNHIVPCTNGYNCTRKVCHFAHLAPEVECEYTYTGELCPDPRHCGKVHQKRCTKGEKCESQNCSYKHPKDMPTEEAKKRYYETMEKYMLCVNKLR